MTVLLVVLAAVLVLLLVLVLVARVRRQASRPPEVTPYVERERVGW